MASRAAERSVTLSLYRAMWRSTMTPAVRHSRFTVPLGNLPDNVSALARRLKPTDQRGLQALLRAGWRDEGGTLDGAFQALRALGELHSECEETVKRRVDKADRRGIHYQIGEVLRHKVFGFRAVVIGWDRLLGLAQQIRWWSRMPAEDVRKSDVFSDNQPTADD